MHPIQPRHFDAGSLTAKGRSTDTSCSKASAVENASIPGLTESSLLCVLMQRVLSACGHGLLSAGEKLLCQKQQHVEGRDRTRSKESNL